MIFFRILFCSVVGWSVKMEVLGPSPGHGKLGECLRCK